MSHKLIHKIISCCIIKEHGMSVTLSGIAAIQMGSYITPCVILSQSDGVFLLFFDLPLVEIVWCLFPTSLLLIYWTLMVFFSHYCKQPPLDLAIFKGLLCFFWHSVTFLGHLVLFLTLQIPSFVKTHQDCTQHKSSDIGNPIQVKSDHQFLSGF